MDTYLKQVRLAVIAFKEQRNFTNSDLAKMMHLSHATIAAKMNGNRRWNVQDLYKLAALGVNVPPLDGDRRDK